MADPVYVIGVGRTDFKRNARKEGKAINDLIVEAGRAAIANAGIAPSEVQAGVVGNFAAGQFLKQQHLGSRLIDIDPALRGMPTTRVEAACASGGLAVLNGASLIMGGLYEIVLVVGAEQQKTMSPADGGEVLGGAGDFATERERFGQLMFPKLFGHIAQIYRNRFGLTDQQLASVACKNRSHARLNPLAQMRDSPLAMADAVGEGDANPRLAPPLKLSDCSQITDGAAALVLCSKRVVERLACAQFIRLLGFGHTTDYLPVDAKDVPVFQIARSSARRAFSMAGLDPSDVQGIDVHDCFSISEILATEIIGLAESGQGARLAETGATMLPKVRGELGLSPTQISAVVNPGGGLIGDGHPVGATGVRQVVEAFTQVNRLAGARQIEDVHNYLTFNMGGSMTTSLTMLWARGH